MNSSKIGAQLPIRLLTVEEGLQVMRRQRGGDGLLAGDVEGWVEPTIG